MSQSLARVTHAVAYDEAAATSGTRRMVAVVEDDDSIRFLLETLLQQAGIPAAGFPTAEAFLNGFDRAATGCLVLDLQLPGMNGLKLQEVLAREDIALPIIFFTARGSVPDAVSALKNGAVDFIEKPFDNRELIGKIRHSLAAGERARERATAARGTHLLVTLTAREREVMERVVSGRLNKSIADELGICVKTVEFHRARVMQKTGARSVAQLVQLVMQSG